MKIRRSISVASVLLLLAAAGVAAIYLTNRREVTTSSAVAYHAFLRGFQNEQRFYKKEARVDYARAIELDPEFAEAILGLARQADREQALSLVERAWTLRDRLTERERFHIDLQRAGLNHNREEALRLAKALHEKYPADIIGIQVLAAFENDEGHVDKAVELYKEILKVDPNYAAAYNNIGYAYGFRGDYEKAIENFQKYQFMAPDQANPFDSMGEIQAYSGHYDEAVASLQKALAIKPDFYPAYEHLGIVYEGKGEYPRAIECYEKAAELSLTGDQKETYFLRALRVTMWAKDSATAEKVMQKMEAMPKGQNSDIRRLFFPAIRDLCEKRYAEAERRLVELRPKLEAHIKGLVKDASYKPYDPGYNMLMVKAKLGQEKDTEAIPLLEEMINPPSQWGEFEGRLWVYSARARLAAILAKRGDLERAEKLLAENHKWNASWAPAREAELAVAQARSAKVDTASK
ncbi:MAG TPA: tetratricopeptide repeat protein [Thermoanaerobaculia bacterium]